MGRDIDAPGASPPPRSSTLWAARHAPSRHARRSSPRGPATSPRGDCTSPAGQKKVTWLFSEKPGEIRQLGGGPGRAEGRRGAGGSRWKSPGLSDRTFSLSSRLLLLGAEIVGRPSGRCGGGRGGIGTLQRRRRGDSARRSFAAAAPVFGSRARRAPCPARRPRVRLRASPRRTDSKRTLRTLCAAPAASSQHGEGQPEPCGPAV